MPDNEEIIEEAPVEEQTEEALDAELLAEYEKAQALVDGTESEEEETPAEPAKEPVRAAITDEEADALVREYAKEKGWQVVIPGEVEAEKESAKVEAKQQTAEEILAGLPDVDLDPAVIEAIDKKYADDPAKRDAAFTVYATRAAMEQMASQKAQEAVAPITQEREQMAWQAKAQATARDIATKAEVPEAQEALSKLIIEAGPEAEERYKTDPLFKKMMDATIKQTVMEIADSLGDQEQKELPRAERVGGGKADAAVSMDTLTGTAKEMAAEYKKDLADKLITKAEYDSFMKDLQKESARQ